MRVRDLKRAVVGLRVRSLTHHDRIGAVVKIDPNDDDFAWILWPADLFPRSGFYGIDCDCEVVEPLPEGVL